MVNRESNYNPFGACAPYIKAVDLHLVEEACGLLYSVSPIVKSDLPSSRLEPLLGRLIGHEEDH